MVRDPVKMISGAILVIWMLAFINLIFLIVSPSDERHKYDFNTNCNIEEFAVLQGKRLIVIAFDYDELLILDDNPFESFSTYDRKSVDFITAYQKKIYLNKFGGFFDLIDISNNTRLLLGHKYGINQAEIYKQLIQENKADGALLIINGYGYSQQIGFIEVLLKRILPKSIFDVSPGMLMSDNPLPERHIIASNMLIFNKNGEIIWDFFGVASIDPIWVPGEEESQRFRIFADCPPRPSDIEIIMKVGIESYANYIIWLLESDLTDNKEKSFFDDYPDGNHEKHILIFPAVNSPYKVRLDEEAMNQRSDELFLFKIWDRVLESDWRVPGQWTQALSASILFIFSFAVLGVVIGISMLFYKIIKSSPQSINFISYIMGPLIPVAMFIIFVTLYFLLKALF